MWRREFLGLLGALALTGCRQAPRREVVGEIVGASFRQGHRLRSGSFPTPQSTTRVGVAILGGGIAGLSAAWKLQKAGWQDFHVYELESEAGGNSRYAHYPASRAPWGAHYISIPGPEARTVREFLTDIGVLTAQGFSDEARCFAPRERLYQYDRWYGGLFPYLGASDDDLRQLAEFEQHMKMQRARKAFVIPLARSQPDPELDRISMAAYMDRHGWTSPRLRWYAAYGCRDDFGCSLENTSAWAGIHYYASRPEEGGYLVWPEGNGFLVRKMLELAGARHSCGWLVFNVEEGDGKVYADMLDVSTGQATRVIADHVVYALPRFTTRYVYAPYRTAAPAWLNDFTYAPWVVANVVVPRPPADVGNQMPLCWDNVVYDSPSLGYVVATHQSLRVAPMPTVLTWYRSYPEMEPAAARQMMLERSWASWRDEVLGELYRLHPELEPERVDVMLWGHGMIRPAPGFIWGPSRAAAPGQIGRVHFAHSDMSGMSIFEEAQYHGVRAAEEVLAACGHPFSTSL
ncbi:MAG: FAD-dependent oxidoreductase [Candidatus Xenobia bacterium]